MADSLPEAAAGDHFTRRRSRDGASRMEQQCPLVVDARRSNRCGSPAASSPAQPRSLYEARTGRSSGSRIILLAAPSHPRIAPNSGRERAGYCARRAAFVPDHSGGTATELHRLPFTPQIAQSTAAIRAPVSVATTNWIIAPPGERVKRHGRSAAIRQPRSENAVNRRFGSFRAARRFAWRNGATRSGFAGGIRVGRMICGDSGAVR